jgi:hypothetical protein
VAMRLLYRGLQWQCGDCIEDSSGNATTLPMTALSTAGSMIPRVRGDSVSADKITLTQKLWGLTRIDYSEAVAYTSAISYSIIFMEYEAIFKKAFTLSVYQKWKISCQGLPLSTVLTKHLSFTNTFRILNV